MKRFNLLLPIIILSLTIEGCSQDSSSYTEQNKPRVIVMSDFPPLDVIPGGDCDGPAEMCSDPDDIQSMVRFLLYTNEFEVEALIASAATFANFANKQNILDILDLYDQVDENLQNHDSDFPTADYLRSVTYEGRDDTWGNPADEILNIEFSTYSNVDFEVILTDILGQNISIDSKRSFSGIYNNKFNLSNLEKGVYFLGIKIDSKFLNKAIVIK